MYVDAPAPNSDRARPVAYWFVPSHTVSQAKKPDSTMLAPAPARKPRVGLPVLTATAKPVMADTSIMPSAPRFTTPAFSFTNKPSAASISGVPALMLAAIKGAIVRARLSMFPPAQFVLDQHVASEQGKQQDALEHARDRAGQPQARLRQFAADIKQGHDEAGKEDADRMQPSHESDDDGGKAVAGRDRGRELPHRPQHFAGARQAGQGAADQQGRP